MYGVIFIMRHTRKLTYSNRLCTGLKTASTYFSANRFCSYFSATEKNSSISAADGISAVGVFRWELTFGEGFFLGVDKESITSPASPRQSSLDALVSLLFKEEKKILEFSHGKQQMAAIYHRHVKGVPYLYGKITRNK